MLCILVCSNATSEPFLLFPYAGLIVGLAQCEWVLPRNITYAAALKTVYYQKLGGSCQYVSKLSF